MISFMRKILKPYKKWLVGVILLQIAGNFLSLYLPTINKDILDYGVVHMDIGYITRKGGLMVLLSFIQIFCSIFANFMSARISLRTGRDLREEIYTKILSYSQKEIKTFGAPTLITRATNDAQQITTFITSLFAIIVSAPIMFVGGIIMALSMDVPLSVTIICMLPVFLIVSACFIKKIIPYYRTQQEKIDEVNSVLRDQISGIRVVKAFIKEDQEKDKMERVSHDLSDLNIAIGKTTSVMTPLFLFIVSVATILIVWYGGIRVEAGHTQIGVVVAMITYASFILSAVMMASVIFILLPRAEVSVGRIEELLQTESSVRNTENCIIPDKILGNISFEHASFSYAPEKSEVEPILKDISFEMRTGETVAIIGSTGCGKTTLVNLLTRLMDVTEGCVKVDGEDIRNINLSSLEAAIGLVPQKAFLFAGTIEQNLRYAKADATEEEVWEALRIAQADIFVRENELGLKSKVSEGGSNFSGGQRQRLAIARAIVRRPSIYIFDDSFSALDYATDRKLRNALKSITTQASVLIVAQRISSIMDADQIIVLNHGQIEAIGKHEELLKSCKTYQEIAMSQPTEEKESAV